MNDDRTAQLSSSWPVPVYAREMLWVEGSGAAVQSFGEHGFFTLEAPVPVITVRWGAPDGPALVSLRWQPDSLDWDGTAAVGGYVDTLHITNIAGLEDAVAVLTLGAQPLLPSTEPYLAARRRSKVPYAVPAFQDGLNADIEESVQTWITYAEGPLAAIAQDALVSKLRVYAFGRLAEDRGAWHKRFALPVLMESLTLFAP